MDDLRRKLSDDGDNTSPEAMNDGDNAPVIPNSGLNDTGARTVASTGALREPATGKGRFDLTSPTIARVLESMLPAIDDGTLYLSRENIFLLYATIDAYYWLEDDDSEHLNHAIQNIIYACGWDSESPSISNAMMRLARHYENGATKYADRNWEKGLPISRCFDSGVRHMQRYIDGDRSEDHLAAAIWNFLAILHYKEYKFYWDNTTVNDLTMPWRTTVKQALEDWLDNQKSYFTAHPFIEDEEKTQKDDE